MASIVPFPSGPIERVNARTFILSEDDKTEIDFLRALSRLEDLIRNRDRAPARVIELASYRAVKG